MIKLYLENIYYPYGLTQAKKTAIKEYTYSIGLIGACLSLNDINCQTNFTRYHNSRCKTTN